MHRKGLVIGILILMLGVNIGSTFAGDVDVKTVSSVCFDGNTLYVGGSGPNNYTTIQSAVDDAVDGDTVFVYDDSSPYTEEVLISKSIMLMGEDKNTTVIESDYPITLSGLGGQIVSGFTILTENTGIEVRRDNVIITNNIIRPIDDYYNWAILIQRCNNNLISENIIINAPYFDEQAYPAGVYINGDFGDGNDNVIANNTFNETIYSKRTAIQIHDGSNNLVENNKIFGGYERGVVIIDKGIIKNNEISNCKEGIVTYGSLFQFTNSIIKNNSLINISGDAIFVCRSKMSDISYNDIRNCENGIKVSFLSNFNTFTNNNLINIKNRKGHFTGFSLKNTWDGNYWGRPREFPKIIVGSIGPFIPSWINIDWNPAQEPYDIEV